MNADRLPSRRLLVPDEVRFIGEVPSFHNGQGFDQQGVWAPQVEMALGAGELFERQGGDLLEAQGAVAMEAPMGGSDLAGGAGYKKA